MDPADGIGARRGLNEVVVVASIQMDLNWASIQEGIIVMEADEGMCSEVVLSWDLCEDFAQNF